ncbi:MAG: glycogen synthase GlgA [Synergistetes bacterium]|nr:glycogen synthase GlgA [Synergistota bacterium]
MNIVIVSSEMVPFVKRGGLADVVGSLSKVLVRRGHTVSVFVPLYRVVDKNGYDFEETLSPVEVWVDGSSRKASFFHVNYEGVDVYFVDNPYYFDREEVYSTSQGDYPDNAQRFGFFSLAVVKVITSNMWKVDVVHCNDWETALIPVFLKKIYGMKIPVLLTIHNLAYQGIFPKDTLPRLGLPWDLFTVDALEFYGNINLLKGGIVFSDLINTVSPTYSKEIQEPSFGFGLDGVLRSRRDDLYGILNGIDVDFWNPEKDESIYQKYNADTVEKKLENKLKLQEDMGLMVKKELPLIGWISRLVDQKGLDLFAIIVDELLAGDVGVVVLGSGEEKYQNLMLDLAERCKSKFAVRIGFDPVLANRIYAASDMFLMPSKFEPCGLGQMIALRYGSIPVVHKTGGLADTVIDYTKDPSNGNGFVFEDYKASSFMDALQRALAVYKDDLAWKGLVKRAMALDFSWDKSAGLYEELYSKAKEKIS